VGPRSSSRNRTVRRLFFGQINTKQQQTQTLHSPYSSSVNDPHETIIANGSSHPCTLVQTTPFYRMQAHWGTRVAEPHHHQTCSTTTSLNRRPPSCRHPSPKLIRLQASSPLGPSNSPGVNPLAPSPTRKNASTAHRLPPPAPLAQAPAPSPELAHELPDAALRRTAPLLLSDAYSLGMRNPPLSCFQSACEHTLLLSYAVHNAPPLKTSTPRPTGGLFMALCQSINRHASLRHACMATSGEASLGSPELWGGGRHLIQDLQTGDNRSAISGMYASMWVKDTPISTHMHTHMRHTHTHTHAQHTHTRSESGIAAATSAFPWSWLNWA
jgi:hypothetical protein